MSQSDFHIATRPKDIPHHDGVTHLMFAPDKYATKTAVKRWKGLRDAIHLAGGHTQVIDGNFQYRYARDLAIIIGGTAYHPSVPETEDGHRLDFRRRAFLPFVEYYGYEMQPLNTLPDYGIDGGNFIAPAQHNILISGNFSLTGDPALMDMDQHRAKNHMAKESGRRHIGLNGDTWHIDTVLGELPDGRLLVKLNEQAWEGAALRAGVKDTYFSLAGIEEHHLDRLANVVDRKKILTFSLFDHPQSDVVCGTKFLKGGKRTSRAFGLAANGITVNGIWVGENLAPALQERLIKDGIRTIGPRDVGVETFVYGDSGFKGAARCLTLQVSHQKPRGFYF